MRAGLWVKVIVVGSVAAWVLVAIATGILSLAGQSGPRAFANACLAVAGLFALGALFRFGGAFLRYSRVTKGPSRDGGAQASPSQAQASPKISRYGIVGPPKEDAATLAFAVLATLVMIQVLVLGFVVGNKA